ncbi:MAG TPA: FAD-dependent oxidoreductase [Saprospiraceae bacterium]|nr:FAD-dependent oxidoreductase [Saprospiraceae bacterium]
MPPAIWYPLQLKEIIRETPGTSRFFFELESDDVLSYAPGQFLTCDLPIGEKRAQRWRSYSIANRSNPENEIEFCISNKNGGLASSYFFNQIAIGDRFKVKGPEGSFVLPEEESIRLFMICTGTGMAPFRAMLQEIESKQLGYKAVHLIFGTRREEDILYRDEIEGWAETIPGFQADLCLSRMDSIPQGGSGKIRFHQGYVHQAYEAVLQENDYPKSSCLFMICGWSAMIDEAVAKLFQDRGFTREQIRYELYG